MIFELWNRYEVAKTLWRWHCRLKTRLRRFEGCWTDWKPSEDDGFINLDNVKLANYSLKQLENWKPLEEEDFDNETESWFYLGIDMKYCKPWNAPDSNFSQFHQKLGKRKKKYV